MKNIITTRTEMGWKWEQNDRVKIPGEYDRECSHGNVRECHGNSEGHSRLPLLSRIVPSCPVT